MKILIIDDHALFTEGLCLVVDKLEGKHIMFEASDFEQAMRQMDAHSDMDLVLLDLNMPGEDGITLLNRFSVKYPAVPVVIVSASKHHNDIKRALDAGALGYIPKDTPSPVMLNALRLVISGGIYVPPDFTQVSHKKKLNNSPVLTPRQMEVLAEIVKGHSNKVIASELELAEATVKMHVTSIMKSLGVTNRTQAAMVAEKMGFFLSES